MSTTPNINYCDKPHYQITVSNEYIHHFKRLKRVMFVCALAYISNRILQFVVLLNCKSLLYLPKTKNKNNNNMILKWL